MPQIHHVCSHLQNAFRARLQRTSIPHSNLNRSFLQLLYRQGFLTAVALGTHKGPHEFFVSPPSSSSQKSAKSSKSSSTSSSNSAITPSPWTTPVAAKRLWVDLKYDAVMSQPVLNSCKVISKPSRRVFAEADEVKSLVKGKKCRRLQYIGLKSPIELGECIVMNTTEGVMDIFTAAQKNLGGEVLASVK